MISATPVFTGNPQNMSLAIAPGKNVTVSFPIVVLHRLDLSIGFLNMWNVTQTMPNGISIVAGIPGNEFELSNMTVQGVPQSPFISLVNGTVPMTMTIAVPHSVSAGHYWFLLVLKAYDSHDNLLYAQDVKVFLNVE
jgi:hypothetical protein